MGLPYTIQDLTNPGLSLIHSAALAAGLNPTKGFKANSPQYFPVASEPERAVHPELFNVRDGKVRTSSLEAPGLGYQVERIQQPIFQASRPSTV